MTTAAADLARRTVRTESGCWLWVGPVMPTGYGNVTMDGRTTTTHRAMYLLSGGTVEDGHVLDHLCCDASECIGGRGCIHRRCINPEHLEPVSNAENVSRGVRASRSHCRNGHEYTPENTGTHSGGGGRYCRKCRSNANRRRYDRQKTIGHKVREWAIENGYEVASRGILPAAIYEAYERAHSERAS